VAEAGHESSALGSIASRRFASGESATRWLSQGSAIAKRSYLPFSATAINSPTKQRYLSKQTHLVNTTKNIYDYEKPSSRQLLFLKNMVHGALSWTRINFLLTSQLHGSPKSFLRKQNKIAEKKTLLTQQNVSLINPQQNGCGDDFNCYNKNLVCCYNNYRSSHNK